MNMVQAKLSLDLTLHACTRTDAHLHVIANFKLVLLIIRRVLGRALGTGPVFSTLRNAAAMVSHLAAT